jgi:hypothetical protein
MQTSEFTIQKKGADLAGFRVVLSFCILTFAFCISASAQNAGPGAYADPQSPGTVSTMPLPQLKNVGFKQHLDASLPLDATFMDDTGRQVTLGQLF